jgi:hypothetical protein
MFYVEYLTARFLMKASGEFFCLWDSVGHEPGAGQIALPESNGVSPQGRLSLIVHATDFSQQSHDGVHINGFRDSKLAKICRVNVKMAQGQVVKHGPLI